MAGWSGITVAEGWGRTWGTLLDGAVGISLIEMGREGRWMVMVMVMVLVAVEGAWDGRSDEVVDMRVGFRRWASFPSLRTVVE